MAVYLHAYNYIVVTGTGFETDSQLGRPIYTLAQWELPGTPDGQSTPCLALHSRQKHDTLQGVCSADRNYRILLIIKNFIIWYRKFCFLQHKIAFVILHDTRLYMRPNLCVDCQLAVC